MRRMRSPAAMLPRGTSRQTIYRKLRAINMQYCPILHPELPLDDIVNDDEGNTGKYELIYKIICCIIVSCNEYQCVPSTSNVLIPMQPLSSEAVSKCGNVDIDILLTFFN